MAKHADRPFGRHEEDRQRIDDQSGPAAGLAAIVLVSITNLGSFETFLLAVILAGLMQLAMGYARAGMFSSYLPSNVIEGMLAGIGVIIVGVVLVARS